jgi:hypothetical protein
MKSVQPTPSHSLPQIIWGAQRHSRRDDPVTAYLYVEYLRLLLGAIIKSRAEPLWLWHELQVWAAANVRGAWEVRWENRNAVTERARQQK